MRTIRLAAVLSILLTMALVTIDAAHAASIV